MRPPAPVRTGPSSPLARLARTGLDRGRLGEAARLGRRWGVPPADALLAANLAEPEDLYRALAAATGLPFLESGTVVVHGLAQFPHAILSGVAPLARDGAEAGPRFVVAPTGNAVADLLRSAGRLSPGLAVTTPAELRRAVFAARAEAIARLAAEDLPRLHPAESFRDGLTVGQLVASHLGCAALVLGATVLGGSALTVLSCLLGAPFIALSSIKLAAVSERVPVRLPARLPRADDRDLPVYTVLVPLHREGRVVRQLVTAMRDLDYPAGKLDVKLLIEEGDRDTAEALGTLPLPGFVEVVTVPHGAPRTKPRALNVGLALARGRFTVVYDAEDVPDPDQLRAAVAVFDRSGQDVACLQARLVIDNARDGWLSRFFALEYGALFDVVNPALARFDLPVPLGGTSNHLRTDVLRGLGGWDPWNVTEDADLAVRLAVAGHRVADLPSATREEAPADARAWLAQRSRWMKGFAQVTVTHSRRPIRNLGRLGLVRLLAAAAMIFGALVSAAFYPIFTALLVGALASGTLLHPDGVADAVAGGLALTTAVAGLLAMVVPPAAGAIRRRRWSLLACVPLMPLYCLFVSLGTWRGLVELVRDPDRWNKTAHGLARTSWGEEGTRPVRSGRGGPWRRPRAAGRG